MRAALIAISFAALLAACESECPTAESNTIAGEPYCGSSCAACSDCGAGFSCQFRAGRGVCVDESFLTAQGVSTACEDPCPTGEARWSDMGTSQCVRICTVDSECSSCCFEPDDIEFRICAPRPALCD